MLSVLPETDKTMMEEYSLESGLHYAAKHLYKAFAALGPCITEATACCNPELRSENKGLKTKIADATLTISQQKHSLATSQEELDLTKAKAESVCAEVRQLRKELKQVEAQYAELVSCSENDRSTAQ